MKHAPRIAVILDENTSGDGSHYDTPKDYFLAVRKVGGLPFGIPYLSELIDVVVEEFDGFLAVGGRFAYPDDWYVEGDVSKFPHSERLGIERAIMNGYLERDKPVLGICAGMQMLACLNGCRLSADIRKAEPYALHHDQRGYIHPVSLAEDSQLAGIVGEGKLDVNSRHREAIVSVGSFAIASAHAPDGIIEAIEIPSKRFAIGLQWHQEGFTASDHAGNRIFKSFVDACRMRRY